MDRKVNKSITISLDLLKKIEKKMKKDNVSFTACVVAMIETYIESIDGE